MVNADLLKGGVIVVVLLAALAAFDAYGGNSFSRITGAYYIYDLESEDATTGQSADGSSGWEWKCHDGSGGGLVHSDARCETYDSFREFSATECRGKCSSQASDVGRGRTVTKCGVSGGFASGDLCTAPKTGTERVLDVLREGEERRDKDAYTVGGRKYDVTLDFVGSTTAKFTVNGEVSRTLSAGEQWRLSDGSWLTVVSTSTEDFVEGTRQAEFILRSGTQDQTAKVTGVAIQNGWNMIAVPTFTNLTNTTCSKNDGSASTGLYDVVQIWNYSSTTAPDYDKFRLSDNLNSLTWITDHPVGGPRHTSAGWVYNYGPSCSITAVIPGSVDKESFTGWAQVAVQPSWEGKALSDLIQPNCDFGGGWFYDSQPSGANWERIESNTKFEQKHTGKGFWAYSYKWCTIG